MGRPTKLLGALFRLVVCLGAWIALGLIGAFMFLLFFAGSLELVLNVINNKVWLDNHLYVGLGIPSFVVMILVCKYYEVLFSINHDIEFGALEWWVPVLTGVTVGVIWPAMWFERHGQNCLWMIIGSVFALICLIAHRYLITRRLIKKGVKLYSLTIDTVLGER